MNMPVWSEPCTLFHNATQIKGFNNHSAIIFYRGGRYTVFLYKGDRQVKAVNWENLHTITKSKPEKKTYIKVARDWVKAGYSVPTIVDEMR